MSANQTGTRRYFERTRPAFPSIDWGRTGLTVSPVGFGSYRISRRSPEHREALRLALQSGCNLIDTSANYGDGDSESLIGEVLEELFKESKLARDEVVVVSKAGYIQGSNLAQARGRAESGAPYPDVVFYGQDLWHCISPPFLEAQITASLGRLKLTRLDALLLHNPEYFLKAGGEHREYYARIRAAFEHLEREVERGRISYYGVSSNTLPEPKESPEYTSLEALLDIATELGAGHFQVIQFPFNLYEPGAAYEQNNSGKSVLEFAQANGLASLINRPLNAFWGRKLIRLADFPAHWEEPVQENLKAALTHAMSLESRYPAREAVPAREIAWGHILRQNFEQLARIDVWPDALAYQVLPALNAALAKLKSHNEYAAWSQQYEEASSKLFSAFTAFVEAQAAVESIKRAKLLERELPELASSPHLSQKAIRIYRSIAPRTPVLVGMRTSAYVNDALSLKPPLEAPADAIESALRKLRSTWGSEGAE